MYKKITYIPVTFKSKYLGKEVMVVGLEDLTTLSILHKEVPKILPHRRRKVRQEQ